MSIRSNRRASDQRCYGIHYLTTVPYRRTTYLDAKSVHRISDSSAVRIVKRLLLHVFVYAVTSVHAIDVTRHSQPLFLC